jgi:ABC-type phosphate/phosphonate transport system substrate-binding protein
MKSTVLSLSLLSATLFAVPVLSAADRAEPDPVQIGMVQTLFTDVPTPIINLLMPPFRGLMKEFTGLNGQIQVGGDAFAVAEKLHGEKVHLAVFHGVEFGWAQQKYPDLRPLMVAVYKDPHLRASIIVKGDSKATNVTELKGQTCGVPFRCREHCRMFIEKECEGCRCDPKSFFSHVTKPMSAESAMDEVLMDKLGAAVIDEVMFENYREVKPGCYKRLRVLKASDIFPTAVVAYRQGALSDETLEKFKSGMMSANKNERGRDLMNLWKISSFEPVPIDYAATVANIIKAYPAPVSATPVSRMP